MKQKVASLKRRLASRFAALRWPLTSLTERIADTRSDGLMNSRAGTKRFPIRGLRYWWIRCAMMEETEGRDGEVVVADVGCSRGHIKRFIGGIPNTRWIGLDWRIDDEALRECGYDELHRCDFNAPLPLSNNSVDIVVFSHVIEHLPRPDFTMGELSRILRPGGLLLAGSPVAPSFVARVREWQLRRRLRKGRIKPGGHINSMDPDRWRKLVCARDMDVEMLTGTYFARWSGNPLENHAWWVRLNQLWGALFPAWGGEVYLAARKAVTSHLETGLAPAKATDQFVIVPKWAWVAAALLLCLGMWGTYTSLMPRSCPIHELAESHQDGNDRFYVVAHPMIGEVRPHAHIGIVNHHREIEVEHQEEKAKGVDAHFLVSIEVLAQLQDIMNRRGLRVIHEVEIRGHRFALLSSEIYGQSGSRGFFSPSPHTTRQAGPHRAVHRVYRAVAG
ncbi:MAG: class I SAM-dependent methyltransferase [Deltaproteobacteria bacterium]|nr:class I SAM-dependent methyltransferase [Deltaproteobacteria bacterium]